MTYSNVLEVRDESGVVLALIVGASQEAALTGLRAAVSEWFQEYAGYWGSPLDQRVPRLTVTMR